MNLALAGIGVFVLACARSAFRRGRRNAVRRLPAVLEAELRAHKLECLHEPPARVQLEIQLLLGERRGSAVVTRVVAAVHRRLARVAPTINGTRTVAPRS